MTGRRIPWTLPALAALLLISACTRPAPSGGSAPPSPGDSASAPPATADTLVLRVDRLGGFVAGQQQGRLPVVSVYADGRVISQGPTTMQYPGRAWPNVVLQHAEVATVERLVAAAGAAGVRAGVDFGHAGGADIPTTRVTVRSAGRTQSVDVVGLSPPPADDHGFTPAQRDARAKLAAFVDQVTALTAAADPLSRAYVPHAVVVFARAYAVPRDGLPTHPAAVPWPGPPLTGPPLSGASAGPDAGCLTVTGAAAQQVLAAAQTATTITPWVSAGKPWSVVFRPLLPDETGCADLGAP